MTITYIASLMSDYLYLGPDNDELKILELFRSRVCVYFTVPPWVYSAGRHNCKGIIP